MKDNKNKINKINIKDFVPELFNHSEQELQELSILADSHYKIEEKRLTIKNFENCGIDERYYTASFENFEVKTNEHNLMLQAAKDFCSKVLNGDYVNLVFTGSSGTGKTHLMVSCLKYFSDKVKEVLYEVPVYYKIQYVTSALLNMKMQQAQSFTNKFNDMDIVNDYSMPDLLVIDELGRAPSQYEQKILFMILDKRYSQGKPTCLATNFTPKELADFLGPALLSRLNHGNALILFDTKGMADHRIIA